MADIKHPRHEEALSGVKASKARLLGEAEECRKEKQQELATKKMQAVTEEMREPESRTAAEGFKIDYRAAARVQKELVTKEIEQIVKLEPENEKTQEKLNAFEALEVEGTEAPSSLSMKLNVISGQTFGMSSVVDNGGPRTKKLHGRYVEVYGPYQVMLNVDGISIYTRTFVTSDSDQIGQTYLGQEELKVCRIGHDAMMEQDAVRIGYDADVTAHLQDTKGKKVGVTGILDTGALVSVMPVETWERMGFTREDLNPTNLRLAAANRGAIHVAGKTQITILHKEGRDLWMSFLVVENLDDSDHFILGRDFVRNFDVMIDLNNGLIRIRNPDRKYVKRPINRK